MVDVMTAIGVAAPYYNLALVAVAVWLFVVLFRTKHKATLMPWVAIFVAVWVYIAEEVFTIVRMLGMVDVPVHVNGFFELVIVSLFIYALFVQQDAAKKLR